MGSQQSAVDQAKSVYDRVKKLEPGDEDSPAIMGAPPAYWLDLKGYNPAEKAKALGRPMLILQGERDYQVSMKDFELWKAAVGSAKGVTTKSYPALNHLFVQSPGMWLSRLWTRSRRSSRNKGSLHEPRSAGDGDEGRRHSDQFQMQAG
jgi:hypothetical protein